MGFSVVTNSLRLRRFGRAAGPQRMVVTSS
jgi:hypothetical protein